MTVLQIINTVLAGGLLGSLGQGIRIAVGLKKLNDSNMAQAAQGKTPEPFSTSRLVISVFIGFVAGALFVFSKDSKTDDYSRETIFAIIAAGYSGADFIEGFFSTYLSKVTASAPPPAPNLPARQTPQQQPLLVNDESTPNTNQVLG